VSPGEHLPSESLSPLAARVDSVLALYGYELEPAISAIDDAVPGYGGLFDPGTEVDDLRAALDTVLDAEPQSALGGSKRGEPASAVVLYVDGSSRGNPGPAGAGAVLQADGTTVARLGRPVGSNSGNNVAEYAALHMGLHALVTRFEPATTEVRIDSMTVVDDVFRGSDPAPDHETYSTAIEDLLSALPAHEWTHLVDSDPNPADARATVGADIAAIGPGG
jgi:ribonuclease HI